MLYRCICDFGVANKGNWYLKVKKVAQYLFISAFCDINYYKTGDFVPLPLAAGDVGGETHLKVTLSVDDF